jgi:site-specific DNA recombinase
LERQQANVVKELREYQPTRDEDIDQQWRGHLRDSFAEIATQRKDLEAQVGGLAARPEAPSLSDPRLLDRFPIIEADLGRLPEDIERELFDGFQLQVRYHQPTRRVTLRATIDGDAIPRLTAASQAIMQRTGHTIRLRNTEKPPTASAVGSPRSFSLAGSAPGGSQNRSATPDTATTPG